ncbi:hypothetical protein [Conexibacter sp. SYSU D00693]|uniref:hypothetical protein n=1 Tax=Conexibacter sp. SYSU D00693 TaxID=2812560 RepID=UPI00196B6BF1|nr:hypothetical protein [Conexibacter sp. SYSU D00693]
MAITPPTDDELRQLVRTQLRQYGVDISVLHATGPSDPATGLPSQASLVDGVVNLIKGSVTTIAGFRAGPGYRQDVQEHPPVEYPAPFSAWTEQL